MKKFKVYSSEVVFYETIVECKSEDEVMSHFEIDPETDIVDYRGYQTDNILEITDEKKFKVTFVEEIENTVEVMAESHAHINKMFKTGSPLIFEDSHETGGQVRLYSIENVKGDDDV